MSAKRTSSDVVTSTSKRSRSSINLEVKLDVLKRFDDGERAVDIARSLGLPATTVRTIRANAEKIRDCAQNITLLSAARITKGRDKVMDNMERLLSNWIEDQCQSNAPVSFIIIQEKAKSLFQDLRKQHGESSTRESFSASRGWFQRFKRRYNLHNVKITGEMANVDFETAKLYTQDLKSIIEEGDYSPQQVFSVDKIGFYWKRMPSRTFISKEEKLASGFNPSKDRLTLLLGGNAYGDVKLKPLLVYHSETPEALKGYSKNNLPVIWRSNKEARVTTSIFQDWFTSYFCPFVKDYCTRNNMDNKALLILDNSPEHPVNLDDLAENVQVVFLPYNMTSLLQPMEQGVALMFKAYYLRRAMTQLISETDGENKRAIREFWCGYNIRDAINNIGASWQEIAPAIMNSAWKNMWPESYNEVESCVKTLPEIQHEIVELSREAGFDEVNEADVETLLESHVEELTNDDLLQLEQYRTEEEEMGLSVSAPPLKQLTPNRLLAAFNFFEAGMQILMEDDPNMERSSAFSRGFEILIHSYKELYQQKKKRSRHLSLHTTIKTEDKAIPVKSPRKNAAKISSAETETVESQEETQQPLELLCLATLSPSDEDAASSASFSE